jgi:hypothetical protein
MKPEVCVKIPPKYANKFTVVGDLIAEVGNRKSGGAGQGAPPLRKIELIGLLPGSKPAKLALGVPLCLSIAQSIHRIRPETRFVIPVAPTIDLQTLARFADPEQNPCLHLFANSAAELHLTESPFLQTTNGLQIELWTETPAYDLLSECSLCLTTVGANTAELGSLAVPMIVLIPMQQLDAMKAWDGLPGLLANLPLVGSVFATVIKLANLAIGKEKNFMLGRIFGRKQR